MTLQDFLTRECGFKRIKVTKIGSADELRIRGPVTGELIQDWITGQIEFENWLKNEVLMIEPKGSWIVVTVK